MSELPLKEATVKGYRQALADFMRWTGETQGGGIGAAARDTLAGLDEAVAGYLVDLFAASPTRGGRQRGVCLHAATRVYGGVPKGGLPRALRVLNGWDSAIPGVSPPPISRGVAKLLAREARGLFGPRMGAAILVIFGGLLRISEALDLVPADVGRPGEGRYEGAAGTRGVRIVSAKTGTEQLAVIDGDVEVAALDFLVDNPSPDGTLLGVSYPTFLKRFHRVVEEAGLGAVGYRPHGLRHGGACFLAARGLSVADIKQRGRWVSDRSLRVYLQRGRALSLAAELPLEVQRRLDKLQRHPGAILGRARWASRRRAAPTIGA
jgi:hypothetical protein